MTSTPTRTLVVELLTEELPPKALKDLGKAFGNSVFDYLRNDHFLMPESTPISYATPRRLAVSISNVLSEAPDQELVERLMPKTQAQDASGKPTPALLGRLKKLGRPHLVEGYPDVWDGTDHLYVQSDGKVDCVWLRSLAKGSTLTPSLQSALERAIDALPIPKVMNYARGGGYYNDIKFVRPAHGLLALHGAAIVPVSVLGLEAGRTTAGHRFLSRPDIEVKTADAYAPTLEAEGKVLPSFAERRDRIVAGLEAAAGGASILMSDALLDEVTGLVEWPKVYPGGFDPAFLELPPECLILTMQQNQKYFALAGADGRLQNRFLLVSNLDIRDPEAIIHGNERVLRARLADAKFFYDQDRKQALASRVPRLAKVVYHHKLGSQLDRVERIRAIARFIAEKTGTDAILVDRAAYLAKADLLTEMVGEFPELQGIMGRYYALHDGEPAEVAEAIGAQYIVRQDPEAWAENSIGAALVAADRTEALVGFFGIGLQPTGDKDPYGLRRAALALISAFDVFGASARVQGGPLQLELRALLQLAASTFQPGTLSATVVTDVEDFVYERYRHQLAAAYEREIVDSVVDKRPPLDEVPSRVNAVREFKRLPEAGALASANKRIVNILKKSGTDAAPAVDRSLFADGAEHDLFAAVQKLLPVVHQHVDRGEYTEALRALASTRKSVDRFFDDVLVMAEDPALRANRLALLRGLAEAMNQVADISKLAV
ncbi:MAG: glycine--tRNA ligase subunit beta [Pseudomonadota bacterium]|nr:glycine--tRNA ligase subunit beta [Pseudomonadota bacterium]